MDHICGCVLKGADVLHAIVCLLTARTRFLLLEEPGEGTYVLLHPCSDENSRPTASANKML